VGRPGPRPRRAPRLTFSVLLMDTGGCRRPAGAGSRCSPAWAVAAAVTQVTGVRTGLHGAERPPGGRTPSCGRHLAERPATAPIVVGTASTSPPNPRSSRPTRPGALPPLPERKRRDRAGPGQPGPRHRKARDWFRAWQRSGGDPGRPKRAAPGIPPLSATIAP